MPDEDRLKALATDYRSMNSMCFTDPPPFGDLIEVLRQLEVRINALPSAG